MLIGIRFIGFYGPDGILSPIEGAGLGLVLPCCTARPSLPALATESVLDKRGRIGVSRYDPFLKNATNEAKGKVRKRSP